MNCLKCKKPLGKSSIYGLHYNCFIDWFQLDQSAEFSDLDPKKHTDYESSDSIKNVKDSFYHGQYRKYSARLNSTHYILKVQEPECPDLPAVEYLCNKIADLLGVKVPEYYLIRYPENHHKQSALTFVTKNFIQESSKTLHHIYKFLPKGDKNYSCENIMNLINEQTKSLKEVEKFVKICLFDAFIGNNDRHGRNLGIIDNGRSKKLAPMYDNPSYFGTVGEDMLLSQFNISCSIGTFQTKNPKFLDYVQEFERLKHKKACLNFTQKIVKQYPLILEEIENSEMSKNRKKAFIKFLSCRLEEVKVSVKKGV